MAAPKKLTTTISTKGQVTLPLEIRRRHRWEAGTRLTVENGPRGVLLKAVSPFPETRPENVFASLPYSGAPKSLKDMQAGIVAEAKRRRARAG